MEHCGRWSILLRCDTCGQVFAEFYSIGIPSIGLVEALYNQQRAHICLPAQEV